MKLSTSTRISLGFTFLLVLVLVIFSFVLYSLFGRGWKRNEMSKIKASMHQQGPVPNQLLPKSQRRGGRIKERFSQIIVLDNNDPLLQAYTGVLHTDGLLRNDNNWYMYISHKDKIYFSDVTAQVQRQHELSTLLLFGILISAGLSFLLGLGFVRWALRDIHALAKKVEQVNIDDFDVNYSLEHLPENDEIAILGSVLQGTMQKLKMQVDDMKLFVANASHELRTPLMILRSTSEVAQKTKTYEESLPKIIDVVDQMEGLIGTLLLLARSDIHAQEKKSIDAYEQLMTVVSQLSKKREEKDISITLPNQSSFTIASYEGSFERIFHNLIDNAYKYSPKHGSIEIFLDEHRCTIRDSGYGIDHQSIAHIREPFWQGDKSRGKDVGFGLGLALVKRLIDLNAWTIDVSSKEGDGTVFSLIF